ncbi:tRNA (N6-isopentenyl adenosine(37)-C2)-methylthiotransferase MiaB [Oligoflexia bacterium]|nr:tRNA (N6-isopentenyl adenosine(37)-C2)-methylthiotransferase MiaB [Oligoflexia bacterium]
MPEKNSSNTQQSQLPGLYIKTYGCQMNVYDTEKLAKILEGQYQWVEEPEAAKLILVNTCSVREKPEHKLFSLLGRLRQMKDKDPDLLVGVGGCVAQQEGEKIVKRSPVVDFVFGTHNLSLVPALIAQKKSSGQAQVAVDYRDEWEELPLGTTGAGQASVFVTISRGCNKACAYCIVPRTRGSEVSRSKEEILKEVRIAAHRGTKEIVFLGQNVNSYGRDLDPKVSFAALLEEASKVDGPERIRFTSPHPQDIRDDFYELMANNPKMCRHVHMPLQSGSDRILKLMNRNYRQQRYLDIIERLKASVPDLAITTDIIVGFPGETRRDFEDTLAVMKTVQFDGSFSFLFSPRPETAAAEMEGCISPAEGSARLQELQALQDEIVAKKLVDWHGREVEVLLDGYSKSDDRLLQGRVSQNFMVNLVREEEALKPGMIIVAKVVGVSRHTLQGEWCCPD